MYHINRGFSCVSSFQGHYFNCAVKSFHLNVSCRKKYHKNNVIYLRRNKTIHSHFLWKDKFSPGYDLDLDIETEKNIDITMILVPQL